MFSDYSRSMPGPEKCHQSSGRVHPLDFSTLRMESFLRRAVTVLPPSSTAVPALIRIYSFLIQEENHDTRVSGPEAQQIRSQDIPFDHRRRQEDRGFSQKEDDLCSGRLVQCCLLYPGGKSTTHRCVEHREGSDNRHSEGGRLFWRRLPYRAAPSPVLRNRDDRLLADANREEGDDGSAS